jgi:hypothetical protein
MDDLEEIENEAALPAHPEWPRPDPVPEGGVPLPPDQQPNPPVESEQ